MKLLNVFVSFVKLCERKSDEKELGELNQEMDQKTNRKKKALAFLRKSNHRDYILRDSNNCDLVVYYKG